MNGTRCMTAVLACVLATSPTGALATSRAGHAFFPRAAMRNLRRNAQRLPIIATWLGQESVRAEQAWTVPPTPLPHLDSGRNLHSADQDVIDADVSRLLALALDARLEGRGASLEQASTYLTAWAGTYVPAGDPAAEEPFLKYLMGYELIRERVVPATRMQVDAFLLRLHDTQVARRLQPGLNVAPWSNKWSMSAAFTTAVAFLLRDPARIEAASTFYARQLEHNVLPAGTFQALYLYADQYPAHADTAYARGVTLDFIQRDALLYHVTSISMLYTAALIAQRNGRPWFAALGGRLGWSYDFLVPYATGRQSHLDFAQSLLSNDAGRVAPFDAAEGIRTLTVAAPLAARFRRYADLTMLDRDAQLLVCASYPPSFWRRR